METGERLMNLEYDLWEYLLVAHPDGEINEKIAEEKNCFQKNYDHEPAVRTQPHITIANFLAKEAMEETLIRWIQNVCNLQTGFTVALNNFSGFPPHTIYVRVQNPKPFAQLANALKILDGFIQSNNCPPLYLVSKPHLTIAEGLSEYTYENAISDYAQKTFSGAFKVDRLVLLKRDIYKKCRVLNTFILPPPVTLFE